MRGERKRSIICSTLSNVGINNAVSSQIAEKKPIFAKKAVSARLLAAVLGSFCWNLLHFLLYNLWKIVTSKINILSEQGSLLV